MDDEASGTAARRRRRRRPGDEASAAGQEVAPEAGSDATPVVAAQPTGTAPRARPKDAERKLRRTRPAHDGGERGLRDIVGAGHSQLGVNGALRARDVNRPTDEDLAEAERTVVVVRRNWQPPDVRK